MVRYFLFYRDEVKKLCKTFAALKTSSVFILIQFYLRILKRVYSVFK